MWSSALLAAVLSTRILALHLPGAEGIEALKLAYLQQRKHVSLTPNLAAILRALTSCLQGEKKDFLNPKVQVSVGVFTSGRHTD